MKDRDNFQSSDGRQEANDKQIQSVFTQMLQQREKATHIYKESGCLELVGKGRMEMEIIREFLPYQLDEVQVEQALLEALAQTKAEKLRDIGRVIAWLKERYAGQKNFSKVCNSLHKKLE